MIGWPNEGDSFRYHLSRVAHWSQNQERCVLPHPHPPQPALPATLGRVRRSAGHAPRWGRSPSPTRPVVQYARQPRRRQPDRSRVGRFPARAALQRLFLCDAPDGDPAGASTQNDYVVAVWLVCLAYGLLTWPARSASVWHSLGIGASLGLAVLTKPRPRSSPPPCSCSCSLLAVGLVAHHAPTASEPRGCCTGAQRAALCPQLRAVRIDCRSTSGRSYPSEQVSTPSATPGLLTLFAMPPCTWAPRSRCSTPA